MSPSETENRSENHPSTPVRPPAVVVVRRSPRNHEASTPARSAARFVAGTRRSPPVAYRSRPRNFTPDEDEVMNDVWEEHLPISGEERDLAYADFCQLIKMKTGEDTTRDVNSLYRRFMRLVKYGVPTGNPRCPVQVRRAKRIHQLILEKAGGFDGGAVEPEALSIENGTQEEASDNEGDAGDGAPVAVGAAARMLSVNRRRHESMTDFQKKLLLDLEKKQESRDRFEKIFLKQVENESKELELREREIKLREREMDDKEEKKRALKKPKRWGEYTKQQKLFFTKNGLKDSDDDSIESSSEDDDNVAK